MNAFLFVPLLALTWAFGFLLIIFASHYFLTVLEGTAAAQGMLVASIGKLFWSTWHRDLGELAMDVLGADAMVDETLAAVLGDFQRIFLFSRADTIYGGSNEIQRNIIAKAVLGL